MRIEGLERIIRDFENIERFGGYLSVESESLIIVIDYKNGGEKSVIHYDLDVKQYLNSFEFAKKLLPGIRHNNHLVCLKHLSNNKQWLLHR